MSKEYNIGIYIRLSMADEDTGYGSKAESDSIGNQRMLINRFLDNHPELSHCQRSEPLAPLACRHARGRSANVRFPARQGAFCPLFGAGSGGQGSLRLLWQGDTAAGKCRVSGLWR